MQPGQNGSPSQHYSCHKQPAGPTAVTGSTLRNAGYDVLRLQTPRLLRLAANERPDLIINDFSMSETDGIELSRRLRPTGSGHHPNFAPESLSRRHRRTPSQESDGADHFLQNPTTNSNSSQGRPTDRTNAPKEALHRSEQRYVSSSTMQTTSYARSRRSLHV
jgi:CheY-like chemotaxis protein